MFAVGLAAVMAGVAIPQVLAALDRQQAWAAEPATACSSRFGSPDRTGRTRLLRYVPRTASGSHLFDAL
jgi:hypothetical protein